MQIEIPEKTARALLQRHLDSAIVAIRRRAAEYPDRDYKEAEAALEELERAISAALFPK